MHKKAVVIACVALTCYGSQMIEETKGVQVSASDLENLATFLLALNPALAHVRHDGPHSSAHARRGSASMNLFDRAMRLVKSNVNSALSSMEDPEKVIEQAVADMQKDLVKVRQAYAEVSASTKRIEEQVKVADADAAKWYERAQLALEKGEEDLAKEALTRRQTQMQTAEGLRGQVENQQASVTKLYDSMKDLERKMQEAKAKKDQIVARARTAKATTDVNDMLAGVGTGNSVAAFERMSEKVEALEAKAEVSQSMAAALPGGTSNLPGSMEDKFLALEAGNSVDDELNKMKKALPSATDQAGEFDDEIEKMKKKMEEEKKK
jgi:phage shock protein A